MENQHRKIAGYRELSQAEIDLMNRIKAKGAELLALHAEVVEHIGRQRDAATMDGSDGEFARLVHAEPGRWAAIAKTDIQTGLMALTRAVAQPSEG